MEKADFLVEIQTEELPPKTLLRLGNSLLTEIESRLQKQGLKFGATQFFATPRRLAVLVKKLTAKQADTTVERKGPALEAAFDANGKPTPACIGFARSCSVSVDQLTTIKTNQGAWVGYQQVVSGKVIQEIIPPLLEQALAALPIAKRMRWGNHTAEFVRPVKSIMLLYGNSVIEANLVGCKSDRLTRGHRFHSKGMVSITKPSQYADKLEKKFVIADFARRKEMIRQQAEKITTLGTVLIDENILDEVTGLVEWPVALFGSFDKTFLSVPQEALISAMQDHQRYFPVADSQGKLLPHFVTISNIVSRDERQVIRGNERVLRARLSDAAFFFATDKKHKLIERLEQLKHIVFQAKLGSLYDKAQRLSRLASYIATKMSIDASAAARAGLLAKTDLTTGMVGEFPELQGVMGRYYALHDGENPAIADALSEHYMPRFSGDQLPATPAGLALALADRVDTLIGVFGIQQAPTGDKDPFGLRRAALGILRILIEKKLNLDLEELLEFAKQGFTASLENQKVVADVQNFVLERLKPWYQDHGISADVFASVAALNLSVPYDIDRRIYAVQQFKQLPEASSLSIANKRVSNILAKSDSDISINKIDEKLFEHSAERTLVIKLAEKRDAVSAFSQAGNYTEVLTQLAELRQPVDDFFDHVMVMAEDRPRRENRILMLKELRALFLNVADIALLQ